MTIQEYVPLVFTAIGTIATITALAFLSLTAHFQRRHVRTHDQHLDSHGRQIRNLQEGVAILQRRLDEQGGRVGTHDGQIAHLRAKTRHMDIPPWTDQEADDVEAAIEAFRAEWERQRLIHEPNPEDHKPHEPGSPGE